MSLKHHCLLHALLMLPFLSSGQIEIGIKSGANISTIKEIIGGPIKKLGWYMGASIKFRVAEKISLQPEILISSKGGSYYPGAPVPPPFSNTKSKLQFNYINLPVLITYSIDRRTNLLIGPELGYLLSVRHKMQNTVFKSDYYYPQKFDIGMDIGAGYLFIKGCSLEVRYSHGFNMIRSRDVTGNYSLERGANRVFQIGLNYRLK